MDCRCPDLLVLEQPAEPSKAAESFIVRDDNGQALAYVYFETKPCTHLAAFIEVTSPDRTIGEARTR